MEIWKSIPDYEGIYEASSLGRIKVLKRIVLDKKGVIQTFQEKILSLINQSNGYLKVNLIKDGIQKTCLVHRVIAITFFGIQKSMTVNHKNGIKTDNRLENLEWCSLSDNHKHAFRLGLKSLRGEKCPNNKIKNEDVFEIRNMLENGFTQKVIAEKFNLSRGHISAIKTGARWNHI